MPLPAVDRPEIPAPSTTARAAAPRLPNRMEPARSPPHSWGYVATPPAPRIPTRPDDPDPRSTPDAASSHRDPAAQPVDSWGYLVAPATTGTDSPHRRHSNKPPQRSPPAPKNPRKHAKPPPPRPRRRPGAEQLPATGNIRTPLHRETAPRTRCRGPKSSSRERGADQRRRGSSPYSSRIICRKVRSSSTCRADAR